MTPEELAAVLDEHPDLGDGFCSQCDADWPCLPYRLAAEVERIREELDESRVLLNRALAEARAEVERLQAEVGEAERRGAEKGWEQGYQDGALRFIPHANPYRRAKRIAHLDPRFASPPNGGVS